MVVDFLRDTDRLESLGELNKSHLLHAAAFNNDVRNANLLASFLPAKQVSRALVGLSVAGGGRESAEILLAAMNEKEGR